MACSTAQGLLAFRAGGCIRRCALFSILVPLIAVTTAQVRAVGPPSAATAGEWAARSAAGYAEQNSGTENANARYAIERDLRAVLSSLPHAEAVVGACAVDLASGVTVFAQSADRPLIPASNTKVFVMAAALIELGPAFAFETILATDGANLILVGDGDPAFGDSKLYERRGESITADFERWADKLVASGVFELPGDIIVDESIFDGQWTHPSWEEADLDNWYAAPVGGLNFNDNCLDITIKPTGAGARVAVEIQPENSLAQVVNKCRSANRGTPVLHHPHDSFEYRISGRCGKTWSFGPVSFPDPGLLCADSFRTTLAKKGVRLSGEIRRGRVRLPDGSLPATLTILGRHKTPLSDVLGRAGKDSQNLFAECLLKRTGYAWARRGGVDDPQGSWTLGAEAVVAGLKRMGVDTTTGLVIADGSGLSRENRCTARQLVSVLAAMHARPEGRIFRDGLSVAGVDGSLRKRLKDMPGRVRGKTGTMRGIRTLSGYVETSSGNDAYAFAVLFNGYRGPSTPYREIQDRFCRVLAAGASQSPVDTRSPSG